MVDSSVIKIFILILLANKKEFFWQKKKYTYKLMVIDKNVLPSRNEKENELIKLPLFEIKKII